VATPSSIRSACNLDAAKQKTDEAVEAQENPRDLERLARQALALCDDYAPAHNALGTALEAMAEYQPAIAEYERARQLDPSFFYPMMGLGDIARTMGDTSGARQRYEQALSLAKSDSERDAARRALAEVEAQTGGGYAFKSARSIAGALRVGEKSIRPKSPGALLSGSDYSPGGSGYEVNLTILFRMNSAEVLAEGKRQLDELGKALKGAKASERYVIEGYASSEGPPDFNQQLSERRARSVLDQIVRIGAVQAHQCSATGKGISEPVMENGTENPVKSRRVKVVRLYDE